MCMTFGCNPQIIFCYFIRNSDLIILGIKHLDTGYLVNATRPTILARSFLKLCRCFVNL